MRPATLALLLLACGPAAAPPSVDAAAGADLAPPPSCTSALTCLDACTDTTCAIACHARMRWAGRALARFTAYLHCAAAAPCGWREGEWRAGDPCVDAACEVERLECVCD